MNNGITLSLSEAVSQLAFGRAIFIEKIITKLYKRKKYHFLNTILNKFYMALDEICDAGYRKEIKIWGKSLNKIDNFSKNLNPLRLLTEAECEDNRLFFPGFDRLYIGKRQGDLYSDVFATEQRDGVDEVRVDRAEFDEFLTKRRSFVTVTKAAGKKAHPLIKLPRLTDPKLRTWCNGLSIADRNLPRDELHKRCKAAHPGHSIARERVRKLLPLQKRGPRPNPPDSTA